MRPVWLVALLAALVSACSGQGSTVQVTGKVVLEGESDHSGVLVSLAGRSALTDKDGAWRVELLSGGSYILQVSATGTLEGMRAVAVEVPAEGSMSAPDVKLTPVGEVDGQVTLGARTGNAGVTVLASGSSAVAVTDDSGNYVLRGVPTGPRTLEVATPGYARKQVQVQVRRDARASAAAVVLSRSSAPAPLFVSVVGASSHAGIVATLVGTEYTATSAADGSFSFAGVPDGTYALSLRGGGIEELVPRVVFQRGEAYADIGVLVPLPPIVLAQARRVFSGGVNENYSSSSDGSRSAPPFVRTADGSQFLLTGRVAGVFDSEYDLRLVPSAGGASVVLAPSVNSFRLSPDGSRIVYLQHNGSLHSRPMGSGSSTQLAILSNGSSYYCCGSYRPYMISPDNTRVVFTNNGVVYSVSITGGAVTLLGPGGGSSSSSQEEFGTFSADGSRFFFAAGSSFGSSGYGGFRVADLRTGSVQTVTTASSLTYQVTPDRNTAVVFSRDYYEKYPLFVVQLTDNGVTSRNVDTQVDDFRLSADGSLLAWRTQSGGVKAMVLPTGAANQLSATSPLLQFSPDGKRLLFTESNTTTTPTTYTLYSLDVAKGERRTLWSGTSAVHQAWFSANGGSHVFFQTPISTTGSYNPSMALNVVSSQGGTVRNLATTMNGSSSGTSSLKATVLGTSSVLLSYDSTTTPRMLQVFPLTGGASFTLGASVDEWELLPDGARVLFVVGGSLRLGQVIDGSSRVVAEQVRTFRMSPDGSKVFYMDINGVGRVTTLATNETRALSDRLSQAYWLDNTQLAFIRNYSSSPQMYQAGLYVATVP